MAMIGYALDEVFLHHRAPEGHPERPARAQAANDALAAAGVATRATRVPVRPATDDELVRVHVPAHLERLARELPGRTGWLDPDTYYAPRSWEIARLAAGTTAELVLRAVSGELPRGLAIVRPPGHHATPDRAMGFCLLNNVAVAAAAARAAGVARVAIVDWDVHHGNGTQDIFWDDPSVFYFSMHQFPYYPGSGAASELGGPHARGATLNVGLPGGAHDAEYLAVFDHVLLPALVRFAPELILISAGFDAYEHDPLAGMRVTRAGFAAMARRLRRAAERLCGGRLVGVLEGGYDLTGIADGVTELFEALVGPPGEPERAAALPGEDTLARAAIDGALAAHAAGGHAIPPAEEVW
jgi:acetoin utilization deacetylase AcuC-like enzyme